MVRSDNSGEKSTILKPLTWLISILLASMILGNYFELPKWILIMFAIIVGIIIILFIVSYIYCLFNDRDALRSEKFSIQKMAIEKGVYGDSISGIQTVNTREISSSTKDESSDNL